MPQQPAQDVAFEQSFELQQSRWSNIGIHAVAAASIYSAPKAKRLGRSIVAPDYTSRLEYATD